MESLLRLEGKKIELKRYEKVRTFEMGNKFKRNL